MISVVVGVDRRSLTHWHGNVQTEDPGDAATRATAMAAADGIDLVIAAIVGPRSAVLPEFPALPAVA
jgi:hypothetical protein